MTTSKLLKELTKQTCSLNKYLTDNEEQFVNEDIKTFWENLIAEKQYSKSNIINKADINYCYFYDILNGRKMPSKDKVVRIALAMKLDLDECQKALKISGRSSLYARDRRDSVLIYAIQNKLTLFQCDELLIKYGEERLK